VACGVVSEKQVIAITLVVIVITLGIRVVLDKITLTSINKVERSFS